MSQNGYFLSIWDLFKFSYFLNELNSWSLNFLVLSLEDNAHKLQCSIVLVICHSPIRLPIFSKKLLSWKKGMGCPSQWTLTAIFQREQATLVSRDTEYELKARSQTLKNISLANGTVLKCSIQILLHFTNWIWCLCPAFPWNLSFDTACQMAHATNCYYSRF